MHHILHDIGLCVLGGLVLALLARALRQPPLLGYIAAGIVLGPRVGLGWIDDEQHIEGLSEIGLVLLLFLIGAEIDLRKLLRAGPAVLWGGLLQLPLCALLHLPLLGLFLGATKGLDLWYLAVLLSLSSTAIVVKLLYEKTELDTLPGRLTVGILVLQDLWAIVMLVLQPRLAAPDLGPLAQSLLLGAGLVAVVLAAGKWLLPIVFHWAASSPELTLLVALGWCVLAGGGAVQCGLSLEMGALIAGITISTFPSSLEVVTRIVSIRDFFVTLFFVTLGLKIPQPAPGIALGALGCAALVLAGRLLVVVPLIRVLARDTRTAVVTAVNLAQVSEFSLVIAAIGLSLGHIAEPTVSLITFTMGLTAVLSPYLLTRSHRIHLLLTPWLRRLWRRAREAEPVEPDAGAGARVLVLGCHRIGRALVDDWVRRAPQRRRELLVVDFGPEARPLLTRLGIRAVYGDVTNLDLLAHLHPEHAEVIVCTLPDSILKGSSNRLLLAALRRMAPNARVVVTAERPDQAAELRRAGAAYVVMPYVSAGIELAQLLAGESCLLAERCESQIERSGRLEE